MIVSFDRRELQDVCLVMQAAEQRLGAVHARALVATIAEIEAFDDCEQMINFNDGQAAILPDDALHLPIGSRYRLRFVVAGARSRRGDDGRVIWSSVTRLKLVEIEDVDE